MSRVDLLVGILAGVVQGVVEWLPISSEGGVSILLTALGIAPELAVQLSLFLHAGTGLAALTYYRGEVAEVLRDLRGWDRHTDPFAPAAETTTFLLVATAGAKGSVCRSHPRRSRRTSATSPR